MGSLFPGMVNRKVEMPSHKIPGIKEGRIGFKLVSLRNIRKDLMARELKMRYCINLPTDGRPG